MPDPDFSIEVSGIKEINRALYSYSQQLGDRVVLSALREGAKLVQKEARARAPKRTGNLRRGIVIKNSKIYSKRRGGSKLGVYMTLRQSKARSAFYGRFIEDGWNTHGKQRSGGGRGKGRKTLPGKTNVRGIKFIKGAFMAKRNQAVLLIKQATERGAAIIKQKVGLR